MTFSEKLGKEYFMLLKLTAESGPNEIVPKAPSKPFNHSNDQRAALAGLLATYFCDIGELSRFVRFNPRSSSIEMPAQERDHRKFAAAIADELSRDNLVDPGFFVALNRERPRMSETLKPVRELFLGLDE